MLRLLRPQVDQEYASRLQAFEGDVQEKQRAYEAFQADEQRKANWYLCPHCNAAWEGSDACSHVTCGVLEQRMGQQRAAGVGCGRQFDLANARRYQPAVAPPPQPASERPEKPASVVHRGVNCDACGDEIRGVRIRCVHCPSYNLCLPCLARNGPDHDAEVRRPLESHACCVAAALAMPP